MDQSRVENAVRELLIALGEDVRRPELAKTPSRAALAWRDLMGGRDQDPVAPLSTLLDVTTFGGQVIAMRDISFRSVCEHHLLPFDGRAHLMYRSSGPIAGLGDFVRTLEILSSRLQLQERLSHQLAESIMEALAPEGVIVILVARHGCVSDRGVREATARTITIASRGCYSAENEVAAAALLMGSATR